MSRLRRDAEDPPGWRVLKVIGAASERGGVIFQACDDAEVAALTQQTTYAVPAPLFRVVSFVARMIVVDRQAFSARFRAIPADVASPALVGEDLLVFLFSYSEVVGYVYGLSGLTPCGLDRAVVCRAPRAGMGSRSLSLEIRVALLARP